MERERLRTALTETPGRVLLSLLAIVFIAEAAVMSALPLLLPKSVDENIKALCDAGLLTLISCPIAWWLLIYPLRSHAHRLTDLNEQLSSEITRRASLESKLRHQALHDSLTDLPNRALFVKRLQASLRRKKKSADYGFAVLFIDLDRFKAINDSLGHAAGDQVLSQVAKRLESIVRPADLLARIGGDEFTLLLEEMLEPEDAAKVAERIIDHLSLPVSLVELETEGKGPELHLTASIGIAWGEARYEHADQLLRDADIAMYRAKSKGWGGFEVFDADMHRRAIEKLWTESALRQSVRSLETENPRFCLQYHPSFLYPTAQIMGFEALLRWRHPERGMVPPAEFIPAAEQTGLILPLGGWALKQACSQLGEWLRQTGEPDREVTMSVNLSGKQLLQPDLVACVKDALESAELPARRLKLEITETLALQNLQGIAATLQELRTLGVGLSIDDFGTGYSSLSRLHRLPFDTLKIDGSFVGRLSFDEESTAIVATINQLAHSLGMSVVAEGVETPEQREILSKLGCEFYQGYLFSRPLESEQARQLLADKRDAPIAAPHAMAAGVS